VLGADHPDTAQSYNNLANLYSAQGKNELAEPLYLRTLEIYQKTLPPDHPTIALILENYARQLREMNRNEEATTLEQQAKEIRAKRSS
jgi:tetratricopeptide (TPR) repeat protein